MAQTGYKNCDCCGSLYSTGETTLFLDEHKDQAPEVAWLLACRVFGLDVANRMFP